jgi:flagellar hook assembly protein FlgD
VIGSLAFGPAGTSAIGTTSTALASRALSPNGDGVQDTIRIGWNHAVELDTLELRLFAANGSLAGTVPLGQRSAGAHAFTWNGAVGGARLPDGRYLAALVGSAGGTTYFNPSTSLLGTTQLESFGLTIDTVVPAVTSSVSRPAISPNGDGIADATSISWAASEPVSGTVRISRGSTVVRSWSLAGTAGTIAWNGRTAAGSLVNDGTYTVRVSGRDAAGNATTRDHTVVVDRTVRLAKTASRFFPHDGDALVPSTTLSWTLARSATVTVQVFRGDTLVRTPIGGRLRAAGTHSWTWNGKDATGAYLPRGFYTIRLTTTSWVGTTVISKTVFSDAFGVLLSAPTRTAGQSLSVIVSPVEPLAAAPRISITQVGNSAVTKTATKLADGRYRAVFTIASGAPGTAIIRITGTDRRGGVNRSTATVLVQ